MSFGPLPDAAGPSVGSSIRRASGVSGQPAGGAGGKHARPGFAGRRVIPRPGGVEAGLRANDVSEVDLSRVHNAASSRESPGGVPAKGVFHEVRVGVAEVASNLVGGGRTILLPGGVASPIDNEPKTDLALVRCADLSRKSLDRGSPKADFLEVSVGAAVGKRTVAGESVSGAASECVTEAASDDGSSGGLLGGGSIVAGAGVAARVLDALKWAGSRILAAPGHVVDSCWSLVLSGRDKIAQLAGSLLSKDSGLTIKEKRREDQLEYLDPKDLGRANQQHGRAGMGGGIPTSAEDVDDPIRYVPSDDDGSDALTVSDVSSMVSVYNADDDEDAESVSSY